MFNSTESPLMFLCIKLSFLVLYFCYLLHGDTIAEDITIDRYDEDEVEGSGDVNTSMEYTGDAAESEDKNAKTKCQKVISFDFSTHSWKPPSQGIDFLVQNLSIQ